MKRKKTTPEHPVINKNFNIPSILLEGLKSKNNAPREVQVAKYKKVFVKNGYFLNFFSKKKDTGVAINKNKKNKIANPVMNSEVVL
ncbi:hypothetical protein [Paenibacillus xylanexedens]|uniref:hypothetical protein n=1 Tax=Paenibacillus xylanexedens TaxID=528191 RepID=UPI003D03043C